MENIAKAIEKIKNDCLYREFDESIPDVVEYVDTNKFYQRVMGLVELMNTIDVDGLEKLNS